MNSVFNAVHFRDLWSRYEMQELIASSHNSINTRVGSIIDGDKYYFLGSLFVEL